MRTILRSMLAVLATTTAALADELNLTSYRPVVNGIPSEAARRKARHETLSVHANAPFTGA